MSNSLYFLVLTRKYKFLQCLKTALPIGEIKFFIPFQVLRVETFFILLGKAAIRKLKSCAIYFLCFNFLEKREVALQMPGEE